MIEIRCLSRLLLLHRDEDIMEAVRSCTQTRLHGGRTHVLAEPKRHVTPTEVVVIPQQFQLMTQSLSGTRMTGATSRQICHRTAQRQIEPFNVRGIHALRIFRVLKRCLMLSHHADHGAHFYTNDAVLSQCLDDLCMDTKDTEELANDPTIVLEPVGRDQWGTGKMPSRHSVIEQVRCVSITSSANDCRDPEA